MKQIRTFYALYRIHIMCGAASVVLIVSAYLLLTQQPGKVADSTTPIALPVTESSTDKVVSPTQVFVDIKGAVKEPNVYEMATDARVKDVIKRAGGLLPNADERQINLAQKVTDQMVIYVAVEGEQTTAVTAQGDKDTPAKVNINQAKVEQLITVPGIGPAKAAIIISYREENGLFGRLEDLLEVSGIGEKTLERLSQYLEV